MENMDLRLYKDEEWSALYVNGKLECVGDHYLADERLRAIMGVKEFDDNSFMRGGNHREQVAQTVEELEAYQDERDAERQQSDDAKFEILKNDMLSAEEKMALAAAMIKTHQREDRQSPQWVKDLAKM